MLKFKTMKVILTDGGYYYLKNYEKIDDFNIK